jgi:hypothetical protein
VSELRRLAKSLIERPLVDPPDLASVQARAGRYRRRRLVQGVAAATAVLMVVSTAAVAALGDSPHHRLQVAGPKTTESTVAGVPTLPTLPLPLGSTTTSSTTASSTTTTVPATTTTTQPPSGCAADNGGATDVGVTASTITILARDGSGLATRAVANRVNQAGGICGRRLVVETDGSNAWPPNAAQPYFAMVPSPIDAFQGHTTDGSLDFPVVGAPGLSSLEYQSGWSWADGSSAAGQIRIMVKDAFDRGARSFAIVYDNQQAYGQEADRAFADYVRTLTGKAPVAEQGLAENAPSYASLANQFNSSCSSGCDYVALAVLPAMATTWWNDGAAKGTKGTGAISTLMSTTVAQSCGSACNGVTVYSPFTPPIGSATTDPDEQAYVQALKAETPTADTANAFTEGEYLGTELLVQALQQTPRPTRSGVQAALDSLTFASGLSPTLQWGPKVPGQRYANTMARAFQFVQTSSGAQLQSMGDFMADPEPGRFP